MPKGWAPWRASTPSRCPTSARSARRWACRSRPSPAPTRIPLATLKGWEQGRRHPDATASAYLSVIARLPSEVREVLRAA